MADDATQFGVAVIGCGWMGRMGELGVSRGTAFQDQPVSTVLVEPGAGDYAAFQPGSALSMTVDDLEVVEAHGFATSIAKGVATGPTLDDAVRSAVALDAMATSTQTGAWVML